MAVAQVPSRAQVGLEAPLVQIEAHLASGLPGFSIVGLPAPVVRESRERVRSAIVNAGFRFPTGRITVNLAPVELAKEGARFDLPIALALLIAGGQLQPRRSPAPECYGELGLSGELRPVHGLLWSAVHAARAGHELIVPMADLPEVRLTRHRRAHGFGNLRAVCEFLAAAGTDDNLLQSGNSGDVLEGESTAHASQFVSYTGQSGSIDDIKGQERAKRTLAIAAAGGHSLLMSGPPGSGKSLLAARLMGLLPPLTEAEALEVAGIASLGAEGFEPASWGRRPFRSPHHSASASAIVGGGVKLRAGEISLAHHGVLFLDELPEYDHRVLEALREPLEAGTITLARAAGQRQLPAQFQLIAAMNPCPCGYLGDPQQACRCGPRRIQRYRERLSGPLLDRIDLHIDVPRVDLRELAATAASVAGSHRPANTPGCAAQWIDAVHQARRRQLLRQQCCNARLDVAGLDRFCVMDVQARALLQRIGRTLALTARGYHRLLKVSRSIADLADADTIGATHVGEAASLRPRLGEPATGS